MRRLGTVLSIPGLAFFMAACTTTEPLIPLVDVGQSSQQSPPVTQGDLDRMAAAADRTPSGTISQVQAYAPQNSRQAQAQALDNGAQFGEPISPPPSAPALAAPPPTPATQQTAAVSPSATAGSIRFLPIIGAPVQAVTPLSRQLGAEARAKGLTIRPSTDTSADNILKGYLSAFEDGDKVTLVYVWDVLDANGVRLHRLQGQESVPARGSDPWAGVNDAVMQKIAARTLDDYQAWRLSSRG